MRLSCGESDFVFPPGNIPLSEHESDDDLGEDEEELEDTFVELRVFVMETLVQPANQVYSLLVILCSLGGSYIS